MVEEFTIRNWREFQHYSDRNPPWIKLHFALLSSQDWVMLADESRVLMIACMLIASRNAGKVPNNPDYIKRLCYIKRVDFKPLIDIGFLECASGCKQSQAEFRSEERRDREEKEKRQRAFSVPTLEDVSQYCQSRNNQVDPVKFHAHYTANGWRVGRTAMRNWQAAIVTWERRLNG